MPTRSDLRRDPPPVARVVHALRAGATLCREVQGPPCDWPPGHTWVGWSDEHGKKLVNCPGCRAELGREP
jgi:hypothetical protein